MEITAAQAYGILSIEDNCILSKDGSITIVFGLKMSEAYTMDASGFDDRHNTITGHSVTSSTDMSISRMSS